MRKVKFAAVQCLAMLLRLPLPAAGAESSAGIDRELSSAAHEFQNSPAKVQPLLQRYGYGAAFAAATVEGMGIATPGQTWLTHKIGKPLIALNFN